MKKDVLQENLSELKINLKIAQAGRWKVKLIENMPMLIVIIILFTFQQTFAAESRMVKVGSDDHFPVIFQDKDGVAQGLYVDLLTEIGLKENIRFEYVFGTWSNTLNLIKFGKIDLLPGVAFSEERSQYMDYCKNPILTVWGELYALQSSEIKSILDISGKKIGVIKSDINAKNFLELTRQFHINCELVELASYEDVFKAVKSKAVDAGVVGISFGASQQGKFGLRSTGVVFNPYDLYISTTKGKNQDLILILDKYLNEWRNKDISVLSNAKQKWIYGSVGTVAVAPDWMINVFILLGIMAVVALAFVMLLKLQIKRATKTLRESEANLLEAHKIARMGQWDLNFATGYLMWSDGIFTLFEVSRETFAVSYQAFLDFVHPDDRVMVDQAYRNSVERKMPYEIEHRLLMKDGRIKWVSEIGRTEYDHAGHPVCSVGTVQDITGRKQAEEELRKSEAIKTKMVSNIGDVIVVIDQNGINQYKSQNVTKLFGWAPEELVGKSSWDNVHPDDLEAVQKFLGTIITEPNATGTTELRYRRKDGDYVWIEITIANLLHDKDIQGVLGNYHDITERKRVEADLRETEEKFRSYIENAPDGIFIADEKGRYVEVNQAACEITGYSEKELLNKSIPDLLQKSELEKGIQHFKEVQQNGSARNEIGFVTKSGENRFWQVAAVKLSDTRFLGFVKDITERKQAEVRLVESEARFKALHNASFGGIAIHDKGVILDCNKGMSELTGYSFEELTRMDGLLLIAPQSRNDVMANIVAGFEKPYEAMGIKKNGEEYPLRLEARNVPYKGKRLRTVEFRDITDLKQAEAEREKLQTQLAQAQKMESVGRLAGGVAHDFNNMLSVIMGNVELVMENMSPNDPHHDNLNEIFSAARRSADVTRQLLAFARKQTIAPEVLDLNRTIESMLKMLRRLMGENIDLAWLPGVNVWPVRMDPSQIDQILANLCVNARDAIADVGKITIETGTATFDSAYCAENPGSVAGDFVLLAVSDDGSGMDQGTLANLFEPFFTTKELGKGTGLGLATIFGIVKQNNGFINVYSEPGQGSTFKIYLPRNLDKIESLDKKTSDNINLDGTETILLVEDERSILKMTRMMLEQMGYKVLVAGTPGEAIALAQEHVGGIHLLITDVVMPEMNGRDLARNLLSLYPNLKQLFMSGYTANVIAHHGVLDQGVQFIQKPFIRQTLAIKVREALGEAK